MRRNRLLIICPTRERPEQLKVMLDSFYATKGENTQILVNVHKKDKRIKDYEQIGRDVCLFSEEEKTLVEVLNSLSRTFLNLYDYFGEVNDDHVYITPGWDKKLINAIRTKGKGWGIACGETKTKKPWNVQRHPSACVISANIIRTLGYFVYPEIKHIYTDCYLRDLADGIFRLFYTPEVIIEHRHYGNGMAKLDNNYKRVYSGEAWKQGADAYWEWYKEHREDDIKKLKVEIKKGEK